MTVGCNQLIALGLVLLYSLALKMASNLITL